MSIKKRVVVAASAVSIIAVAAAPTFHRTRTRARCELPERDYQYHSFSQPKRSLSRPGDLINVPLATMFGPESLSGSVLGAAGSKQLRVKSFQFVENPTLQTDHCSISQMSVLLHESGRWTISLQANQNRLVADPVMDVTTMEPKRLFTGHLQRNEFQVVARCYAQYGPDDPSGLLGKPLVIPLVVKPFWVQRQQPHPLFVTDFHPDVQLYFDAIDRVEIEFAYRLD